MVRSLILAALVAPALAAAAPPPAAPASTAGHAALAQVIDDHWRWWLAEHPVAASKLGDRSGDGRLGDLSLAAEDRRAAQAQAFLDRLRAVPDAGLSDTERTNKAVLARQLGEQIEENRFGERQMLFNTYSGWYQDFASLPDESPFNDARDYRSYLDRLAAYPRLNADAIAITRGAIAGGYVWPCEVLGGIEQSIIGVIAASPEQSRLYAPFAKPRPAGVVAGEWSAMQARARTLIRDVVEPEYRRWAGVYRTEYQPRCRRTVAAEALPEGAAWYRLQAREHTTTMLSPDAIHRIGLAEVARIDALMTAVARQAGYPSAAAYSAFLRRDPASFAATPDALIAAAATESKRHDALLPHYFGVLPRLTYGVRAIPPETAGQTTSAYYGPGSPEAGIAGTLWINTSKLDQRPVWEFGALIAHEGVPGHHLQIARAQELDLPPFRRQAQFTAFVEGWALYAERLGEEMGLYDTPARRMGRLSLEAWRASRLVVDTGLHTKGWTKPQAVAFLRAHTALSDANIDAEVNRYISWPGQALGYKIGELTIVRLRGRAEAALGARFDLRRFHDAVLGGGAMPLDALDAAVDRWISGEQARVPTPAPRP